MSTKNRPVVILTPPLTPIEATFLNGEMKLTSLDSFVLLPLIDKKPILTLLPKLDPISCLILGEEAFHIFYNRSIPDSRGEWFRGVAYPQTENMWCLATYHPSVILQGKSNVEHVRFRADVQSFANELPILRLETGFGIIRTGKEDDWRESLASNRRIVIPTRKRKGNVHLGNSLPGIGD